MPAAAESSSRWKLGILLRAEPSTALWGAAKPMGPLCFPDAPLFNAVCEDVPVRVLCGTHIPIDPAAACGPDLLTINSLKNPYLRRSALRHRINIFLELPEVALDLRSLSHLPFP